MFDKKYLQYNRTLARRPKFERISFSLDAWDKSHFVFNMQQILWAVLVQLMFKSRTEVNTFQCWKYSYQFKSFSLFLREMELKKQTLHEGKYNITNVPRFGSYWEWSVSLNTRTQLSHLLFYSRTSRDSKNIQSALNKLCPPPH